MDNSEIHYLTYDPEEIFREMQLAYVNAGGDVLYPGDEKEMLLRSVQAVMVQAFAGMDNALRMATLRYAVGDYLDLYGENRGCYRITAKEAESSAQFHFAETGSRKIFPAGTTLTADGDVLWELENDLEHSGKDQIITAAIVARNAGSAGNLLKAGTMLQMAGGGSAVISIYCASDASGGNDREDDDTYRERIRAFGLAAVTTGPKDRYEGAALSASSRVTDARAVSPGPGEVAVYLLISGEDARDSVISAVYAALNDNTLRPLTDHVTVAAAEEKKYQLDVQYVAEGGEDISAAVSAAVNGYAEWQCGKIGRAFNPDRLTVALYEAGCQRVFYKSSSNFDGGAVAYTEIGQNQVCTGRITVEEST